MKISFRIKDWKWTKKFRWGYWGKKLCEVYPHASWFQAKRFTFNRFMEKVLAVSGAIALFVGMLYGSFKTGQATTQSSVTHANEVIDNSDKLFTSKIDSLKNAVVDELMACEGATYNEDSGLVTFDPTDAQFANMVNSQTKKTIVDKGEMSYGILQFKKSTVIYYNKLMTGKTLTGKEALLIALDKDESSKLAKFVMFETKGKASGDWKNCAKALDLDKKIDLIKKLEK